MFAICGATTAPPDEDTTMARASLALLFVLLLAGTAIQTLSTDRATVAPGPDAATPLAPTAPGDSGPASLLRVGSACADIVARSNRLLRSPRRVDDIVRGEDPCAAF
jgi:hypothetical protein